MGSAKAKMAYDGEIEGIAREALVYCGYAKECPHGSLLYRHNDPERLKSAYKRVSKNYAGSTDYSLVDIRDAVKRVAMWSGECSACDKDKYGDD